MVFGAFGDPPLTNAMARFSVRDWEWLGCGLAEKSEHKNDLSTYHFDLWLRLQYKYFLSSPEMGFGNGRFTEIMPTGSQFNWGEYAIHEEGDLFFARRPQWSEEETRTVLANVLNGKAAPDLSTKLWFDTPGEASLQKLPGKVVLLYFWSGLEYQPWASSIQQRINDDRLVVIGVHPNKDSEKIEALIAEKRIPIPIAIDTARAETERKYSIKVWPSYFLIDKTGKVSQGYLDHPPPEQDIENLLK